MDFYKTTKVLPLLALLLLLATLVSADPAEEDTLTVAYATKDTPTNATLSVAHRQDTVRINAQIRADLRVELDHSMSASLETLLAAARPPADED